MTEYHVAKTGNDKGSGLSQDPFLTISKAASAAMAGDTITVHTGVYREWVKPVNKGLSNLRRITYQAAEAEKVIIKGSEQIKEWQQVEGTVWKAVIPNTFFKGYNPYSEIVSGDWMATFEEVKHLGDVYLNGMSFYEAGSFEELISPEIKAEILDNWTEKMVPSQNPEQTRYVWFTETDDKNTTIFANFHNADPNQELVEINVRKACFYPEETGIDYITVKGFEMAHAATQWAPPTADQPGLIGAHWSKGWIIENNIIHDAKCSAVSIGKEISTGHNFRTVRKDKPGYQYQLESVFSAERNGWSKEKIGSHIIRNNTIYDCGQNAIVGHLGCVFTEIHNNHIYNIALKREFYGYEIAGIKLHAAIDVQIHHNRIHNCSLGMWLDWQTQGTRVSKNLFYSNNRDCYIEVSHGPYLVDHNILASEYALDNVSQGGAYINNLIAGKMIHRKVLNRSTQYHLPHSTQIAGFSHTYGGDDRFSNNIFIGNDNIEGVGTAHFNGYATSLEEYIEKVHQKKFGDINVYESVEQPVYITDNAYFNGAESFEKESNPYINYPFNPDFSIHDEGDEVYLSCSMPDNFSQCCGAIHSTDSLGRVRIVDAEFENPDGSTLILDSDLLGSQKREKSSLGPINRLKKGKNFIKVW